MDVPCYSAFLAENKILIGKEKAAGGIFWSGGVISAKSYA
jgi:hypothetical protein